MTIEDIELIKKQILAETDLRYVRVEICNERQERNAANFAKDDKRIDLIIQNQKHSDKKMTLNNWLTTAILGVIITLAFKFFVGG